MPCQIGRASLTIYESRIFRREWDKSGPMENSRAQCLTMVAQNGGSGFRLLFFRFVHLSPGRAATRKNPAPAKRNRAFQT